MQNRNVRSVDCTTRLGGFGTNRAAVDQGPLWYGGMLARMTTGTIVLITMPYDQADIVKDFLDWHLDLGIDLILAVDGGSTDGTRDVLEEYASTGRVVWFPLPDRDMTRYSIADELAALARDRYHADWIIYADVDEFVCTNGRPVRAVLAEAELEGVTRLDIPRRTMTGPMIPPGRRATEVLTLRIDRTAVPTAEEQLGGELAMPFVFLEVGPHLALRAAALGAIGHGVHVAVTTWGKSGTSDLYILHYAIRGYADFRHKVRNTEKWLADNPHLNPGWGWHWRRWIRLEKEGRLRQDYEQQFVSADRAEKLLRDGSCVVDTTIATWLGDRRNQRDEDVRQWPGWVQRVIRAVRPAARSATH